MTRLAVQKATRLTADATLVQYMVKLSVQFGQFKVDLLLLVLAIWCVPAQKQKNRKMDVLVFCAGRRIKGKN